MDEDRAAGDEDGTDDVEVSAMAINIAIPADLQWTATRRERAFRLQTLNVRMLPDGGLAAKAYGRPVEGGRSGYVAFPVPDRPELDALVRAGARQAARAWTAAADPDRPPRPDRHETGVDAARAPD